MAAHIIKWPVGDKLDELLRVRYVGLQRTDELLRHLEVGVLGFTSNVVRLAVDALVKDGDEGARDVADVDKVARVGAVAVDAARQAWRAWGTAAVSDRGVPWLGGVGSATYVSPLSSRRTNLGMTFSGYWWGPKTLFPRVMITGRLNER